MPNEQNDVWSQKLLSDSEKLYSSESLHGLILFLFIWITVSMNQKRGFLHCHTCEGNMNGKKISEGVYCRELCINASSLP